MNDDFLLKVVKSALIIENSLSKVVYQLFNIQNPISKKLFKPSNFSAKNKIDLLKDLELISTDDYNLILLQMEIRNVFIHNLEVIDIDQCFEYMRNQGNNKINMFNKLSGENYLEKFDNLTLINIEVIKRIQENEVKRVFKITNEIISLVGFIHSNQKCILDVYKELEKIKKINDIDKIKKNLQLVNFKLLNKNFELQKEYEKNELFKLNLHNGFVK